MTQAIETRVRSIVARVAKLDGDGAALNADADLFRELGVESTAALDLLLSLEEEFGVSIDDQAFGDSRTVNALAALVGKLLA
ncbi:MAG TPA: acyl carrier protein [Polyangia bacterium]|nr:acyl carrier protein [Polyangia bacterium]